MGESSDMMGYIVVMFRLVARDRDMERWRRKFGIEGPRRFFER